MNQKGYAQTEPDEIVAKTDEFDNNFFEAIKQKGMENFDKAIESLEKCANLQPKNAVVYFELGKNDILTAFYWYQKAGENGNRDGLFNIGSC